jgi:hypothetical protein
VLTPPTPHCTTVCHAAVHEGPRLVKAYICHCKLRKYVLRNCCACLPSERRPFAGPQCKILLSAHGSVRSAYFLQS